MNNPLVLPPSVEVSRATCESESVEPSPLSTASTVVADAAHQQCGDPPGSSPRKSQRTSARSRTCIYKASLKLVGVLCGLGALTLAWIALKSPTNPNRIDFQSLAAMNKSADSQVTSNKLNLQSLTKLQDELAVERKQLETEREIFRHEVDLLDLQRWTAQRQFIKDCLEYHKGYNMTSTRCTDAIKAWDEPPPSWSETNSPRTSQQRSHIVPLSVESSQTSLMDEVSIRSTTCKTLNTASICPNPRYRNQTGNG